MVISYRLSKAGLTLSGFLALSCPALATDYLRGAYGGQAQQSSGTDWAGFYGGVHAGISGYKVDPGVLSSPLAKEALPNSAYQNLLLATINLKTTEKNAATLGAFGGVNWQWDDVVLGFEADYTRSNISAKSNYGPYGLYDTIGTQRVDITSVSSTKTSLKQWGTIRGRAGWATSYFMPYLTAGLALAQVDTEANVDGIIEQYLPPGTPANPKGTPISTGPLSGAIKRSGILYGAAVGAGIDVQIVPNTFLRAEWQYIQFAPGTSRPDISINTARVAGGVKF